MHPSVSWLGGGDADRAGDAFLGEPVWGAHELLRDLELRLGLPSLEVSAATRTHAYAQRLGALVSDQPFYARSFALDRHGTATTLLGWRDLLVEAGWSGEPVANAGRRVAVLGELERRSDPPLPSGRADRLVRVERELAGVRLSPYLGLRLLEQLEVWPGWKCPDFVDTQGSPR